MLESEIERPVATMFGTNVSHHGWLMIKKRAFPFLFLKMILICISFTDINTESLNNFYH